MAQKLSAPIIKSNILGKTIIKSSNASKKGTHEFETKPLSRKDVMSIGTATGGRSNSWLNCLKNITTPIYSRKPIDKLYSKYVLAKCKLILENQSNYVNGRHSRKSYTDMIKNKIISKSNEKARFKNIIGVEDHPAFVDYSNIMKKTKEHVPNMYNYLQPTHNPKLIQSFDLPSCIDDFQEDIHQKFKNVHFENVNESSSYTDYLTSPAEEDIYSTSCYSFLTTSSTTAFHQLKEHEHLYDEECLLLDCEDNIKPSISNDTDLMSDRKLKQEPPLTYNQSNGEENYLLANETPEEEETPLDTHEIIKILLDIDLDAKEFQDMVFNLNYPIYNVNQIKDIYKEYMYSYKSPSEVFSIAKEIGGQDVHWLNLIDILREKLDCRNDVVALYESYKP